MQGVGGNKMKINVITFQFQDCWMAQIN